MSMMFQKFDKMKLDGLSKKVEFTVLHLYTHIFFPFRTAPQG